MNRNLERLHYLLVCLLILVGVSYGQDQDDVDCDEFEQAECIDSMHCDWVDDECISSNDDNDDDESDDQIDEYLYRAHVRLETELETYDHSFLGKIKARVTEDEVHILEFDLKHLFEDIDYTVILNGLYEYSFTPSQNGHFDWVMRSDGLGDELLPEELMPVTNLITASLLESPGGMIASGAFVTDDDGCEDLQEEICTAAPFCTWDIEEGCLENDWDFDEEDDWEEGEFFIEDIQELYDEYMDYYNLSGDGNFNFVVITDEVFRGSRSIDIGSEIGLLDYEGVVASLDCIPESGQAVVGSGVWTGDPIILFAFGSFDSCDSGGDVFPGFIESNPVVLRIWNADSQWSYDIVMNETWMGNQSVVQLTLPNVPLDLNGDGSLDILDVVFIVDIILGGTTPNSIADYNHDGYIDVVDVILVIDYILAVRI